MRNIDYIYNLLDEMRKRPAMYLGTKSISLLRAYINGFSHAMLKFDLLESGINITPIPFAYFDDYCSNFYKIPRSCAGWNNIILHRNNNDESSALDSFYMILDEFRKIEIVNKFEFSLSDENISYHYYSEKAPRRVIESENLKTEPIFKNPKKLYILELSSNSGCICIVQTQAENIADRTLFKSKHEAEMHFKLYFGEPLNWKQTETIPEKIRYI